MISQLRKVIFSLQSELRTNPDERLFQALDLMSEVEIERSLFNKIESGNNNLPDSTQSNCLHPDWAVWIYDDYAKCQKCSKIL